MCGIAGFLNRPKNWRAEIEKMNARMLHRGPDGGGIWANEEKTVVLGHRRLSIMDLSEAGAQPMESRDGRFVISYNGEIYNFVSIREALKKEGLAFKSSCDTEVLLEALSHWGVEKTLEAVKGMFAFALYDKKERRLILARDRIGEKPLYYGFIGNGAQGDGGNCFAFASELSCIAGLSGFANPVNTEILNIYFVHGYIPAPYTIYRDIFKLEPGKWLELSFPFTSPRLHTYWDIREIAARGQENLFEGTEEEAAEELERLLKEALKGQLAADVPVGAFLSAGIDSSTIVSLMQEVSASRVRTFTIGMEDRQYNEAPIAAEIAQVLGTEHTEMMISEKDMEEVIPKLAHIYSEPFADSSQIPTYLVSRLTRQHVTVSLSGDGGDELFCGYGTYPSVERIWNKMGRIPWSVRKAASALLLANPFGKSKVYRTKSMLLGAKDPAQLYELDNREEPLALTLSLDRTEAPYAYNTYQYGRIKELNHNIMLMDMLMYHPDDILVKVDRCGMAVSLESRIPFLDKDVVEFAWSLPIEYKYKDGMTKRILRDILYRYVPKELMDLPKRGFSIPVQKWLLEPELRSWAEGMISRDKLEKQGLLNVDIVRLIWDDFTIRGIWRNQVWYILMFQQWMEEKGARN